MGKLNGRDRRFKRQSGRPSHGTGSRRGFAPSITLAALTLVPCDGISRFVCSEPTQNLTGSKRVRVDSTAKRNSNVQTKFPQSCRYQKYRPAIRMLCAPRYLGKSYRQFPYDQL